MRNDARPARKPDWTALVVPLVVGVFFIAFYASLLKAPPIDRVFITPLMIVGTVVLAAVLWEEVRALRGGARSSGGAPEPITEPWSVAGFVGLMLLYFLGLEYVGFFVSSLTMLVAGMLWLGVRSPVQLALVSFGVVGIEYLLFAEVLEIPFPRSAIGLF